MWIILKDRLDNRDIIIKSEDFPAHYKLSISEIQYICPIKFILLDDDDVIYFEGYMSDYTFEPLDELGEAYGCTELRYFENDRWIIL